MFNKMENFYNEALISEKLQAQNNKIVGDFQANNLEVKAQKHWDMFYKRNSTHFYKNRNWLTREFPELLCEAKNSSGTLKRMLEVGCGVGNLVFPLIENPNNMYFIYACDFSPRAIKFLKNNELYNEKNVLAFQCDITTNTVFKSIEEESLDIITMVFVLSSIHPNKFKFVVNILYKLLKPGGVILFRDYGLHDMAQLRFKSGNKIADNFYMRQDLTRSFFFSTEYTKDLFKDSGFEIEMNCFVYRRTVNQKMQLDVQRKFVQGKYRKPVQTGK